MRARRNHKLEDRNDHPRIKETRFHVVVREARQTKLVLPRNCKGSRSEYVTREAPPSVSDASAFSVTAARQTRILPWIRMHRAGKRMHFLARLNLKGPPACGFRPKCFNYSRYKSVGNVKRTGHRLKNEKWRGYASWRRRRLRARIKHRIKLEEKQRRTRRDNDVATTGLYLVWTRTHKGSIILISRLFWFAGAKKRLKNSQ